MDSRERRKTRIRLVVGLGNPGANYEWTYHNAGAAFIRYLATEWHIKKFLSPRSGKFSYFSRDAITYLTTATFMNESGDAVRAALTLFKATPEEFLLVHDDADIPLGRYKESFGRGAAGHYGVLSVIHALHTNKFFRLRIGVRNTPGKAGEFVLHLMRAGERRRLYSVFEEMRAKVIENEMP